MHPASGLHVCVPQWQLNVWFCGSHDFTVCRRFTTVPPKSGRCLVCRWPPWQPRFQTARRTVARRQALAVPRAAGGKTRRTAGQFPLWDKTESPCDTDVPRHHSEPSQVRSHGVFWSLFAWKMSNQGVIHQFHHNTILYWTCLDEDTNFANITKSIVIQFCDWYVTTSNAYLTQSITGAFILTPKKNNFNIIW